MTETFRQYIKIRTFLGYRPKEILLDLQNAFGDQAPTYASVQRWSKRFRDTIDSPSTSERSQQNLIESNHLPRQINANAKRSESVQDTVKGSRSHSTHSKARPILNE